MSRPTTFSRPPPSLTSYSLVLLFTLSIFGTFASAIPPLKRATTAPPVPTVEECKAHITTPPTDQSIFYTLNTVDSAREFAIEQVPRLYLLEDIIDDISDYANSPNSPWSQAEKDLFWDNCSQAFAELTRGVTFVVLPSVIPVTPEVWKRIEYNALVGNLDVDLIVKVIAENFNNQTILWPCSSGGTQYTCPDNVPFTGGTTLMSV